ncbi:MAG: hypothetical protein LW808_001945 [Verrucomicrobiota bacterium]|nr:MAG: hypothetical protein LW808_001945 [Verrucomicrobiota bacterium]
MKRFRFVASFMLFLGLFLGEGGECDIYIANAGAGNCAFVRFSAGDGDGKQLYRGLWVDCGFGKRGFFPNGFSSSKEWNDVVGDYFFREEGVSRKVGKENAMLWVTHLHDDHINGIFSINKSGMARGEAPTSKEMATIKKEVEELEKDEDGKDGELVEKEETSELEELEGQKEEKGRKEIDVGSIIVGIGGSKDGLPKSSGRALIKTSESIKGILKDKSTGKVLKVRVWGEGSEASAKCGDISKVVGNFWGDFPRENIKMEPLIPTGGYEQEQENLEANDTSLVLGLEYYGIKVLFPGDAPGKMCDCLNPDQKGFVKDVDILIAPHHGSEGKKNSLWYSSNRRFCTIVSGDPSYKAWGIPGLANYGVRNHSTRLEAPRAIYYSNAQRNEVLKSEIEFPVFCTWVGIEDEDGKVVGAQKFVGYHIKINSNGNREDAGKIKVFEILYNDKAKENETRYPEEEIYIERLSKRRKLELSGTSVLFEVPTATGGGSVGH